jgi:hypothetical protein
MVGEPAGRHPRLTDTAKGDNERIPAQQERPGHDRLGEQQLRMEAPVNVVDDIPEPHRTTFVSVLEDKDQELLRTLSTTTVPTYAMWHVVLYTFMDARSEHFGPATNLTGPANGSTTRLARS